MGWFLRTLAFHAASLSGEAAAQGGLMAGRMKLREPFIGARWICQPD